MNATRTNQGKRTYGSFAIAAMAYVAGVAAFSAWFYLQNRSSLLERDDRVLKDAVFSVREMIDPKRLATSAEHENTTNSPNAEIRNKLARYAKNCRLAAVGATASDGAETFSLVVGGAPSLPASVGALGLDLAESTGGGLATLSLDDPKLGRIRVAALYLDEGAGAGVVYLAAMKTDHESGLLREQAIRAYVAGAFLLVMVVPLITLYNRAQKRAAKNLSEMNARLRKDVGQQRRREEELKDAIHDLERFNAVSAGRESRVIELKKEVNVLLEQLKRTKRYNIDRTD